MGGLEGLRAGAVALLSSRSSGRSGRRAHWSMRFTIPIKNDGDMNNIAEPVIFVNASYPDPYDTTKTYLFHRFKQHKYSLGNNKFATIVCSAGVDGKGNCIGCYDYAHGKKWAEAKEYAAFNIAHLGWYHDTPLLDQHTNQVIYKRNEPGQPVMVREACEAQGATLQCKWCQAGYARIYGGHRYLEVGTGHLESIVNMDKELQQTCMGCGSQVLTPPSRYRCASCETEVMSIEWLVQAGYTTQDQVSAYLDAPQPCFQCQNQDPLKPLYECGFVNGTKMGRCCEPGKTKVATLFDTVVYMCRVKGKLTTLVGSPKLTFDQFVPPQGGRKPLDVLADVYKTPFDFAELYKPDDTATQAKRLGCQDPFGQAAPGYQPYPGPAAWQQPGQVPPPQQPPQGQQYQQYPPPAQPQAPQYPQPQQYQQPPQGYVPPPQGLPPQFPQQPNQVPPPPPPPSPGVPGMPPRPFGR